MRFLFDILPKDVESFIEGHPFGHLIRFLINALSTVLYLSFLVAVVYVAQRANKRLFEHIEKRRGKKIHLQFLERVINIAIVGIIIIIPLAGDSIGKSILGSAAVLTAVVGFAAQDVIKDVLSGFLISVYKPFDIGDRVELEDGTVGIIENITMRHVLIIRIDTLRMVVPNSRINSMTILNYSLGEAARSALFKFQVSYDTDISLAKKVIAEAIEASPYSVKGKKMKDGSMGYGSVYFMEMADSSLVMNVTVYYEETSASELVKDDINTRVFNALNEAGIEIPYSYTNVVLHGNGGSDMIQRRGD